MVRAVAFLLIALAVAGCGREPRYQMMAVNGAVVRLDTATGEMLLYQNTTTGAMLVTELRPGQPGLPSGR